MHPFQMFLHMFEIDCVFQYPKCWTTFFGFEIHNIKHVATRKGNFTNWTPCIVQNCLRQELGYIVLMTAVSIKYRKSRCIGETNGKYKMCIFSVFRGKYSQTPLDWLQKCNADVESWMNCVGTQYT